MAKYFNPQTQLVEEWGTNPELLNPEGIKGKTLVPETTATGSHLDSTSLEPATPINLPNAPADTTDYAAMIKGINDMNAAMFKAPATTEPDWFSKYLKEPESLTSLYETEYGKAGIEEKQTASLEAQKQLDLLNAEMAGLTAESQGVPIQVEKEFLGRAGVSQQEGISRARLRDIALKALPLQAQILSQQAVLTGNQNALKLAQDKLSQVFSLKQQDQQHLYDYNKDLRNSIYDYATTKEKERLVQLQTADDRKWDLYKTNLSTAQSWAKTAMENGQADIAADITQLDPNLATFKQELGILTEKIQVKGKLNTQIVEIGGRKLLIDTQTGQTVKDLGSVIVPGEVIIPTKPATAAQQTTAGYAARAEQANNLLSGFEQKISGMSYLKFKLQSMLPSTWQSSEFQQYDQAARNFINSILRPESGAAISESEFDNAYKQYIPRAGDSIATLKQKEDNRRLKIESLKQAAGSAYTSPEQLLGGNAQQSTVESEVYVAPDGTEYVKGEDGLYYPK